MKRLLILWVLLISSAIVMMAQTRVTVTGVITDVGGNPATSGTVTFALMPTLSNVNFSVAGLGVLVPLTTTCGIDGSGNVKNQALSGVCLVWGNDVISPGGTTYTITTNPNGSFGSTVAQQCINGAGPYDMTRPNFCGPFKIQPQYSIQYASPASVNLLPQCSGCFNLGSASLPWGSIFVNNVVAKNVNNILNVSSYGSLSACYAAIPSSGGTCVVSPGYTETFSTSLTLNKSYAGFLFLGPALITMGSNQVIVSPSTHGVFLKGLVPYGSLANVCATCGVTFDYSGNGRAFNIGGSSTTDRLFGMENIQIYLHSANAATGLYLTNVVYFNLTNVAITGSSAVGSIGIVCDGTGNFCGTGSIINPLITFVQTGIQGQGISSVSMNAVTIVGGTIQSSTGAPMANSIGIDLEAGYQDMVLNCDVESEATAVKYGQYALDEWVNIRSESNTTDFLASSGSQRVTGIARGNASVIVSDSGTNNHFSLATDGNFNNLTLTGTSVTNLLAGTGQKFIQFSNTGNSGFYFGIESSVGGGFFTGSNAYDSVLYGTNDLFIRNTNTRFSGNIKLTNTLLLSQTAPTISSGFGASPSILSNNGTITFRINVGTGGTATTGIIGMPAATTGWNCQFTDMTTHSNFPQQTASTTTTVNVGGFNSAGAATAWVASDTLIANCLAY